MFIDIFTEFSPLSVVIGSSELFPHSKILSGMDIDYSLIKYDKCCTLCPIMEAERLRKS